MRRISWIITRSGELPFPSQPSPPPPPASFLSLSAPLLPAPTTTTPASRSLRIGGTGTQKEAVCVPLGVFPKQPLEHSKERPCGEQGGSRSLSYGLEALRIPWVGRCPQSFGGAASRLRELSEFKHLGTEPTLSLPAAIQLPPTISS